MPYTYLIGWTNLNKWYYGVKYKNGDGPEGLWVNYFTSSKHVKKFRKEHGDPDIIQVRRVFESREEAGEWEHKVIRRLGAVDSDKWLNKSDTKVHDRTGIKHTEEVKKMMSQARKGTNHRPIGSYKHSEEVKQKMRIAHLKFKDTKEGKVMHEKTSKNLRKDYWSKGMVTCPYCNLTSTGPTMARWHFENCKERKV